MRTDWYPVEQEIEKTGYLMLESVQRDFNTREGRIVLRVKDRRADNAVWAIPWPNYLPEDASVEAIVRHVDVQADFHLRAYAVDMRNWYKDMAERVGA